MMINFTCSGIFFLNILGHKFFARDFIAMILDFVFMVDIFSK